MTNFCRTAEACPILGGHGEGDEGFQFPRGLSVVPGLCLSHSLRGRNGKRRQAARRCAPIASPPRRIRVCETRRGEMPHQMAEGSGDRLRSIEKEADQAPASSVNLRMHGPTSLTFVARETSRQEKPLGYLRLRARMAPSAPMPSSPSAAAGGTGTTGGPLRKLSLARLEVPGLKPASCT